MIAGSQGRRTSEATLNRTTLSTSRLLDFCSRKELIAQTGHEPRDWPLVVLKELVDNALDACEETEVAPEIKITVNDDGITVADNGPGIPVSTIESVLDFSIRVSSREAYVAPDRGAQGNALKTIVSMPYVLNGTQGTVIVDALGIRHEIVMQVDHVRQQPVIDHQQTKKVGRPRRGTSVTVCMPLLDSQPDEDDEFLQNDEDDESACLQDGLKRRFLQIASGFTWLNPHLTLTMDWFGERTITKATDPEWKKWRPSDPTSPHWYGPEHLGRLITGYIAHDQDNGEGRVRLIRELIGEFQGITGSAKQKLVLDATDLHRQPLTAMMNGTGLDMPRVESLLMAMQDQSRPIKHARLGIIGKEHLRQRFEEHGCEMSTFKYKKVFDETDGRPEVLEVAFGWCPGFAEKRRLVTGVNWSAAIISPFRSLGETGVSLDSMLAHLYCGEDEEVVIVMHYTTPLAEFTDRGKSAVVMASMDPENIRSAVRAVTKKYTDERRKQERRNERDDRAFERSMRESDNWDKEDLKEIAFDIMERIYNEVSSNGERPAYIRQIMYRVRPEILERTGKTKLSKTFPNYFSQKIWPEYARTHDVSSWDVVFDPRGNLTEPHTRKGVPLGTLDVRDYLRGDGWVDEPDFRMSTDFPTKGPDNRFDALLFCEKEGFNPLFRQVKLAERWDIAILSTKGQSVTAARDLILKLGLPTFVTHDFDKDGFSIFGAMKRGTERYPTPLDNVIDIGLRLEDVEKYGLLSEPFVPKGDSWAVRENLELNGATEDEIEFLMTRRVELNAFTSNDFIAWIESKLAEHGVKKVVPDDDTLEKAYRRAVQITYVNGHIEEIEDAAEEHAEEITIPDDLGERVRKGLKKDRHLPWDDVIAELVGQEE